MSNKNPSKDKPDISIEKLTPPDWQTYKELRLEALSQEANVFCPTYDEFKFTKEDWQERLSSEKVAIFALFKDKTPIGLTGVVTDRTDETEETGLLVMSYIKKDFRRRGLSTLFYEARINWAREHPKIKRLLVGHREGNEASKRANQHFGFSLVKTSERCWPDGETAKLLEYRLEL